ncbi:dolichyl-P-Man:Man(5)GlcNAc(2)-PP-dolichol alpha-1,3-mannosyltransferase [Coemansia guatemalensis]|uniref:Dol-P-Man:Man(5)GlcNAc(2)-PP-Dol alpha-1,3-mannosyltransferase n=1 Tax=Coemansia guatemalensis TaxID=2761395 RepID=A0A9W8HSZ4_9FUNG|nr:dolichyl-P-Man:Man(5)GlcNAc(2)-PP-dolichol alpha-1,3-mannosyltransferase [Coemansia guatemalensis]
MSSPSYCPQHRSPPATQQQQQRTTGQSLTSRAWTLAQTVLLTQRFYTAAAAAILAFEVLINIAIIQRVAYTEIDWQAYMQQIAAVAEGERNYARIRGDTGPLVYPAGFVWVYRALWAATDGGADVRRAQYIFMGVYLATLVCVLAIYRTARVPVLWLVPLALSRRLHSLYVLRLFNDAVAMLPAYLALATLCAGRLRWSGAALSAGIAVKMNVQLMLPGAAFVWWRCGGLRMVATQTAAVLAIQALVALPFLCTHPSEYFARAFEYSRRFDFKWTVNWRFVGEHIFGSSIWAASLLTAHLLLLLYLGLRVWPRLSGRSASSIIRKGMTLHRHHTRVDAEEAAAVVLSANFVGVVCARTLHYQFYAWYAHTLPFLLYRSRLPLPAQLALWLAIEYAWNVYPSTIASSLLLLAAHCVILATILRWRQLQPRHEEVHLKSA